MQPDRGIDQLRSYDQWLNIASFALTIIIVAVGCSMLLGPLEAQMVKLQTDAAELERLVQQAPRINEINRRLKEELIEATRAADQIEKRIPSSPRESDFLAQISQLANRVGLEVLDYRSGSIQLFENHREMEVTLKTRATYEALCRFLEQVEEIPRLSRLVTLEIAPESVATSLSIALTFRIYFSSPAEIVSTQRKN